MRLEDSILDSAPTMDTLTAEQRSRTMSRVRSAGTKPEMAVRRLVHALGYRFRLHRRDLPGTPDLAFPGSRKVIFMHGCFWHGHRCRAGRNRPGSNLAYWTAKLDRNKVRDRAALRKLRRLGWSVLVLWECEVKKEARLRERIEAFLGSAQGPARATTLDRNTDVRPRRGSVVRVVLKRRNG